MRSSFTASIAAVALLAWPHNTLLPGIDGDWAWIAALSIAAEHGPRFGSELIWTYGPLGYLTAGPYVYYDAIGLVGFAYHWILQLLVAATFFFAAKRSYPWPVAAIVAFLVVAAAGPIHEIALGFGVCALALTRLDGAPRDLLAKLFPVAAGVLASLTLLGKINFGVELTVMAAIAVTCQPGARRRDALTFSAALLASVAVGWFATGQSAAGIAPYLRYGLETIRGYAVAQGAPSTHAWHYLGALLLFAIPSLIVWQNARKALPRRRWGLVALWLVYAFASFKQGFVRADEGHAALYGMSMLVAAAVLPVGTLRTWLPLPAGGIAAALAFIAIVGSGTLVSNVTHPLQNADAAVRSVRTLLDGTQRSQLHRQYVAAVRDHYRLPPAISAEIAERTVAFWPFSRGDLAYAYSLNWRPPPVLEPLQATTAALDSANADMLASAAAPERIVRSQTPVTDRSSPDELPVKFFLEPPYYPPLSTRALFCHYRELARRDSWQLLAHRADRCGRLTQIGSVVAPWGQPVNVPPPRGGSAVLVKVDGAKPAGLENLQAFFLRPDPRVVFFDGRPYRFPPSSGSAGLLVRASPAVEHESPFGMSPDAKAVAVAREGGGAGGTLRYTFFEMPVDGAAVAK